MLDKQTHKLTATCSFGLESLVSDELHALGYTDLQKENGKVTFQGTAHDIAKTNIWLRTADRIVIQMAQFEALDFDTLFDNVHALPWEKILPPDAFIHVNGRSKDSKLFSIRDCQSLTKKAIIKALQRRYKQKTFTEDGATFKIEIALKKNIATLTLDTTGPSLHKRGYRSDAGEAPLKETMAAALVLLSKWTPPRIFSDPFCGSGTLGIEAALIALNKAPGIDRHFTAERWPGFLAPFQEARRAAKKEELDLEFKVLCSDRDYHVLQKARENAINAGVENHVFFQKLDAAEFRSRKKYGCIISNLPYGERLDVSEDLYPDLITFMKELDSWSFFYLSSDRFLAKAIDKKASKRRKLYNGKIECHYHQFYGPLPRPPRDESVAKITP